MYRIRIYPTMTHIKVSTIFCIAFVTILTVQNVIGRPNKGYFDPVYKKLGEGCQKNAQMDETCQKCAKITKSPIVYPLCCNNEDDGFDWCRKYVNFGIHMETKRNYEYVVTNGIDKH